MRRGARSRSGSRRRSYAGKRRRRRKTTRNIASTYADWGALDHQYALYQGNFGSRSRSAEENRQNRDRDPARTVLSYGGSYSIRGDADHVARELKALHDAGFDGVAMGFVNYLDELPFFAQEVIPRLQAMGLRRTPTTA